MQLNCNLNLAPARLGHRAAGSERGCARRREFGASTQKYNAPGIKTEVHKKDDKKAGSLMEIQG